MDTNRTRMNIELFVLVLLMPLLLLANRLSGPGGDGVTDLRSDKPSEETAVQQQDTDNNIETLPGFEVQLLYDVPLDEQGSWVALAVGPDGSIIASDQAQAGLYRIDVSGGIDNPQVDVTPFQMPISGAQGLEYAFGDLYINVNGGGLYRLSDNAGHQIQDFNVLEYLGGPVFGGEHGNHSIIPTPDGEGLYVVNGNHTPPADFTSSRVASWDEDLLLPRNWDPRGHARGITAPGGVLYKINPDASRWEVYSMGYRNNFDIATNQFGDVFGYDADMEWDMGSPWYRPTRITHLTSGSDYGWRSGSGKWKTYFEDSLPPIVNIGPGSPTGLLFGYGTKFPAKYQRAMYALDWTFGTMRAIHLTPSGSSYTADVEEFVSGIPLPLTDAVVGDDGYLYFATGGRGGESHLWRVVYRGNESTAPAEPVDNPEARQARQERRQLEAFHGHQDPEAVDTAWPYLASQDRFLRYAARVAIEWQPVETWADRALSETRPQAKITAMVALARSAEREQYRDEATNALINMNVASLTADQKLGYLRALSLVFQRLGDPTAQQRTRITNALERQLPNDDARVNVELVRDLVYLRDTRVIDKALALMDNEAPEAGAPNWDESLLERSERYGGTINEMIENPPPTNKIEYAYMLRNMREGWTIDQRRKYFTFINEASTRAGGASYTGYLEHMRDEALSNASEEEIAAVSDLTGVELGRQPDFEINPPEGPGREWTVEAAEQTLYGDQQGRNRTIEGSPNFERGRSLFFSVGCASCHRFDGFGGNIGPDLNTVARRRSGSDMLEDIINPSAIISDQYGSSEVRLNNGDTISGLVVERENNVEVYTRDPDQPPTVIPSSQVASIRPVAVSQMPEGLLNSLNPDELRDLVAYLLSGGDPQADVYAGTSSSE